MRSTRFSVLEAGLPYYARDMRVRKRCHFAAPTCSCEEDRPVRRNAIAGFVAGVGVLAACSESPQMSAPSEQAPAPLLAAGRSQEPDRYIVVFKSSVVDPDRTTDDAVRGNGAEVRHRYSSGTQGLRGANPRSGTRTHPQQSQRGIRRGGRRSPGHRDADQPAQLGTRPHRPASPAAQQRVQLRQHRHGRPGATYSTPASGTLTSSSAAARSPGWISWTAMPSRRTVPPT